MNATKEWPRILGIEGQTISEEIIGQRYREMAKKYHPDAGGTVDDMQQLNAAKQLALRWLAGEKQRREELARAQKIAALHFTVAQETLRTAYQQQANAQSAYANQMGSLFGGLAGMGAQNVAQSMANSPLSNAAAKPAPAKENTWTKLREFLNRNKG